LIFSLLFIILIIDGSGHVIDGDTKAASIILSKIQKYNHYKREVKIMMEQIRSLGEVVEIF